ncbi:MAG: DUF4382 domain-containing protein [Desulfuromonadales bacterium]
MISNELKRSKLFFIVLIALLIGFLLTACGGSGSGDSATISADAGQGSLQVTLVDASSGSYKAVYVTIARVEVHLGGNESDNGNWLVVAEPNKTYNLLELVNGVREELGLVSLEAGQYSQMRLIIGLEPSAGQNILSQDHPFANYVIDEDGDEIHALIVPSGLNTGLKLVKEFQINSNQTTELILDFLVKEFQINSNQTTELILDFDAMRSVVTRGNSGKDYILKPTIKVRTESDAAIVAGTVTDNPPVTDSPTDPSPLPGSFITAQTTNDSAVDPKDEVVIETGTTADDNGDYALFIAPGDYNFVATSTGYDPACVTTTLSPNEIATTIDFALTENNPPAGTVSVKVDIPSGNEEQYATIDFRSQIDCANDLNELLPTWVTVATVNIANGSSGNLDLPEGDYKVIASSFGIESPIPQEVTVQSGQENQIDIIF